MFDRASNVLLSFSGMFSTLFHKYTNDCIGILASSFVVEKIAGKGMNALGGFIYESLPIPEGIGYWINSPAIYGWDQNC